MTFVRDRQRDIGREFLCFGEREPCRDRQRVIRVRNRDHGVRELFSHLGAVRVSPSNHKNRFRPVRTRDRRVPSRGLNKPVPQIRMNRPLGAVAENHGVPELLLRRTPDEAVSAVVFDRVGRDRVRTEIGFEIVPVEARSPDRDEVHAAGNPRIRPRKQLPHKAVHAVIKEKKRVPDK